MKARFHQVVGQRDNLSQKTLDLQSKIESVADDVMMLEESIQKLFIFNEYMNSVMKNKLEAITNIALKSIFPDKDLTFRVVANRQKRGIMYDLYIETNGMTTKLVDSKGGGVLDVIAMCIRISYTHMLKGKIRQSIFMDEPFKNLDVDRVNLAAEWMDGISKSLGIQFLIVTHIPAFIDRIEDGVEMKVENDKSVMF